jgi:hypothetical protein
MINSWQWIDEQLKLKMQHLLYELNKKDSPIWAQYWLEKKEMQGD